MNPYWVSLFLASLVLSQPVYSSDEKISSEKALQIAQRQPHLMQLMKKLEGEAELIQDLSLRKEGRSILKGLKFKVIAAHRKNTPEIIRILLKEGLLEKGITPASVFPKQDPIPFLAAPGSVWLGHHSYPGGLVYHTLTNLRLGLSYASVYREIYGLQLNTDFIRLAAILHDSAKTLTIPWNSDGSCAQSELMIAGTAAHHIFAIAEAIERQYPPQFVVILASAHSPPLAGKPLQELINYLKAGAILAEAPFTAAGLSMDGIKLATLPPPEAFVNHLDDHDYVFTQTSIATVNATLDFSDHSSDFWKRNEILSGKGDFLFYSDLIKKQQNGL